MLSESTRAYIYRVAVVSLPLLISFGIVRENDATLWIGVAGALLVPGMAALNTSTDSV